MNEYDGYKVLIAYRPFDEKTPPEQWSEITPDEDIVWVKNHLDNSGMDTEILYVGRDVEEVLNGYDPRDTVIFNYCDGYAYTDEEDTYEQTGYDPVTKIFETLDFAFTGADNETLWGGQDKAIAKSQLVQNGIPTPLYRIYDTSAVADWDIFPALVKPSRQHSSMGISQKSVVKNHEELKQRVEYVLDTWKQPALVEEYIQGPEVRTSLWGNGKLEVLPLLRIHYPYAVDPRYAVMDYDSKWDESRIAYELPARFEPQVKRRIEKVAKAAYRATGMRDYGSMDIRVRDGQPYVIDPNQNADMSEVSYIIRQVLEAGYSEAQFVSGLVRLASERRPHLRPAPKPVRQRAAMKVKA
ncbi:MAG: hypothetical protein R3E39_15960 [Anaerolineae bacterium]